MKTAIIIGGTSGIGRALAELLFKHQWTVAVSGRRTERLEEIRKASNGKIVTIQQDISMLEEAAQQLDALFKHFTKVDLVVVSSGFAELNQQLEWEVENKIIQTNVNGIARMYQSAFLHFKKQGYGHLVGISSIASIRGNRHCPSYSASKAFQANYLESLRCIAANEHLPITVTDVQPGFVDTPMAMGDGLFWVAPVPKAASQIYHAILKGKKKIYLTKRWRLIAWALKVAPKRLIERL